ncbi:HAMP domain-containing sensor histidine kinase [Vibrio sp. Isolate24]|uniref:sensor histidine kinase n=1 Tax=Vibrio sp. Isolate24 TaxID=2908534 RepID=UPI001EFE128E|nr:HAMP domain-containing sensor histidine kinase [Vibrio sp. Isolate24]MCG9677406.1 HAMP domain-containing histidine kinase [Vibrio sp. Isolate24]
MISEIPSLKRYTLIVLLTSAVILVTLMSALWMLHFFSSQDNMIKGALLEVAHRSESDHLEANHRFLKTSNWHDLPIEIRRHFTREQLIPDRLYQKSDRDSLFSRPTESVFLLSLARPNGEIHYAAHHFKEPPNIPAPYWFTSPEVQAVFLGLCALSFFFMILLMFMNSVTKPIKELYGWARELDAQNLSAAPPGFRYKELNTLAQIILDSVRKTNASLEREQEFVQYASHELRTPIAVIRSSVELMEKVEQQWEVKSHRAMQRIKDASHCMAELCNTLLWLNKAEDSQLSTQPVDLSSLLHSEMENLSYLTQGKSIEVQIRTDSYEVNLPYAAVQMIIANLLRNAVQHTHEGMITIDQRQGAVQIINRERQEDHEYYAEHSGFGLGLILVKRLCQQLGWSFSFEKRHDQCYASLFIKKPNFRLANR